jgi:hypothetical protein
MMDAAQEAGRTKATTGTWSRVARLIEDYPDGKTSETKYERS